MTPTKQRLVIAGLIVLGVLFAGFFGMRALRAIRYIHDGGFGPGRSHSPPSETDVELVRDWMTIPYIARTYGVPARILFKELNIPDKNNQEKSLKELNEEYYPDQDDYVLDEIKKAILKHRPPMAPIAPAP
jgi:hypothetical protein